jgi:hypothetical protein
VEFIVTVHFRINIAAKECKQATRGIKNTFCSQGGWKILRLCIFISVHEAKTCPCFDVDKFVEQFSSSARLPYGNVYMKI